MVPVKKRKLFGEILVDMKLATAKQIDEALKEQKAAPGPDASAGTPRRKIGQILAEQKIISPAHITAVLANQSGLKFVRISSGTIPPEITKLVPKNMAMEHKLIPVKKVGRVITVALAEPLDMFTLDNIRFALNSEIDCVLATEEEINFALSKYYASGVDEIGVLMGEADADRVTTRGKEARDELTDDDAPIIKLVNTIIAESVKSRASDIHIEPMEHDLRVRYRIDGVCQQIEAPPKRLQSSILSRIKLMAGMDIAEKRKPQDGRIPVVVEGKEFDIRVSALPSSHGESVVMRLLEKESLVTLDQLGFHGNDYQRFSAIIKRPNGIFLVTGPTGSGKTTTLYAAIKELNKPNVKIITAEDPVEYVLPGVNQSRVRSDIGFTFASIIRAMLRQAPNIILVGEIRDVETAEIAIQAALTGHLVFSTLHTNDAPSAVTRWLDMGVKPFLVASSIQAIMAQRLIRMLCPKCKEPYEPSEAELKSIGLDAKKIKGKTLYKPHGCSECKNTGYKGRKGLFELMEMDSTLRDLTFQRESTLKMREQAKIGGMVSLIEDGVRKVLDGLTAIEEIIAMTAREDLS
ncbi:MAG: Flp pilus assembly complex ATPase component TadA [Planctomycetes bacterium]|nr:Flp pilus assembly complex ATPase component TadA [Planctomycetota bacterium]